MTVLKWIFLFWIPFSVYSSEGTFSTVFTTTTEWFHLLEKDKDQIQGLSQRIGIGYGALDSTRFLQGELSLILGPYDKTQDGRLDIDYDGFGMTVSAGVTAPDQLLQTSHFTYGFLVEGNYTGLTGRSVGPHYPVETTQNILKFGNGTTLVTLSSGMFIGSIEKPRASGDAPSELVTRIHGYLLSFLFALPLYSSYQSRFTEALTPESDPSAKSLDGRYKGYSFLLKFVTLFG